ncbi:hypothetical protein RBB79_17610 [Tunturiibacter empetritectus]|uniref:ABC-type transport system involved in multi-copper enzyme maturation permease subunit n=1 Tax=Tunturiibacter lichenicola TaxID=2051959 RepID=A0A852VN06_9BACT|nr:hypothetical protein [Edaphobacter lichenicola]NYF91455.1 ABC-type transport system involved in multi-copper enzyme maturation permease subunit [Edaphobacter lichenicola]
MTSTLFLGFVALMTTFVVALIDRYINRRAAVRLLAGLLVWFLYAGLMAHFGILSNSETRPPGIAFIVGPVLLFLIFFIVQPSASTQAVLAFPLWLILGTQCFRIGVELFLHQLWIEGLVPRMMTFAGANIDIYIGLSAPVIAWLSTRGRWGLKFASAWNILGLLALLNVVTRAILTAPGPLHLIHSEIPDRMISTFPFLLIPGFFVPLAVVLHLLAIRAINSRLSTGNGTNPIDAIRVRANSR